MRERLLLALVICSLSGGAVAQYVTPAPIIPPPPPPPANIAEPQPDMTSGSSSNDAHEVDPREIGGVRPPPNVPSDIRGFAIYFDFEKTALQPEAVVTIRDATETARSDEPKLIVITAHCDTAEHNPDQLSLKRAQAVEAELVHDGIQADAHIVTIGDGTRHLSISTGKNVREQNNRNTEIALKP